MMNQHQAPIPLRAVNSWLFDAVITSRRDNGDRFIVALAENNENPTWKEREPGRGRILPRRFVNFCKDGHIPSPETGFIMWILRRRKVS